MQYVIEVQILNLGLHDAVKYTLCNNCCLGYFFVNSYNSENAVVQL